MPRPPDSATSVERKIAAPGIQRRIHRPVFGSVLTAILTLVSAAAVAHALIKANLSHFVDGFARHSIWTWNLVDQNNGVLIFVGMLTLLAMRWQIASSLTPILSYEGNYTETSDFRTSPGAASGQDYRQIRIINGGPGMLLMLGSTYRVAFEAEPGSIEEAAWLEYEEIIHAMDERGLIWGSQYYLSHISAGYAMPSGHQRLVVELSREAYLRLKGLDIRYRFRSALGDVFEKEVFAVPRVEGERKRTRIFMAR